MHGDHEPVARHLGNHRSGRDARGDAVALPHAQPARPEARDSEPVSQDVGRPDSEGRHRAPHALDVRLVQSDAIDVRRWDHDRGPGERPAHDLRVDPLTSSWGEQLGVREPGHLAPTVVRQDHRTHDERASARSATCLVGAGDRLEASLGEAALEGIQVPHRRNPTSFSTRNRHLERLLAQLLAPSVSTPASQPQRPHRQHRRHADRRRQGGRRHIRDRHARRP